MRIANRRFPRAIVRLAALLIAVCLLPAAALADEDSGKHTDWVTFLLICNEGMNNNKGNAGNTLMIVAMNPQTGTIRLLMFTWDTFIDYEGYDAPQRLDVPYRNNGPEESVRVLNANFDTEITKFMSLNYLNLASLIDAYDGVTVDITRAERNALNGMVGSKKAELQSMVSSGLLSQETLDTLADEYYLEPFGPDTLLNGLQAVGFGWLQYDSVYNCCVRDVKVIGAMFHSVGESIAQHVAFYTDATGEPEDAEGRRPVNLDAMTDEDRAFLRRLVQPVFDKSYHNLTDEDIDSITCALARTAYQARRQGVNIFDDLDHMVLPLEAKDPYDVIAGALGHLVDKDANAAAIREFLYSAD